MPFHTSPDEYGGILGAETEGIPSEAEFFAAYRETYPEVPPPQPFHIAFALFRFAVIFVGIADRAAQGTAGATRGTPSTAGSQAASGSRSAAAATTLGGPLDDAVIDKAQALLAQHVGPIAKVLARRAATGIDSRAVFFNRLAEAVSDPTARDRLLAELARLR